MERGSAPTGIGAPAVNVTVSIGVTLSDPLLTTYAVLPSGVMAIAWGWEPTRIGRPAVRVVVSIGVTLSDPRSTTKASRPPGVVAIASGSRPTRIGLPALREASTIGVTLAEAELTTNAVGRGARVSAARSRTRPVAQRGAVAVAPSGGHRTRRWWGWHSGRSGSACRVPAPPRSSSAGCSAYIGLWM